MSEYEANRNFKTIIIGKSGVGKSTLLLRYVEGEFNPQKPTIGIDYRFKKVSYENTSFNLELWDSAGQERYRTIVYNYFSLSKAAVIVFDITSEESLSEAKMWMQQLVLHCGNEIPKVLLGNKSDKLDREALKEQVDKFQPTIDKLKEEYNCKFFTVSAYTGENVEQAFEYLIKELHQNNKNIDEEEGKAGKNSGNSNNFKLNKKSVIEESKPRKDKKCC
jgi:small GTP-binding protein